MTNLLSPSLRNKVRDAAIKAISEGMILQTECAALIERAENELVSFGRTYICGVTIRNVRQWPTSDYSKWSDEQLRGL
jgi:hypothetical protein